MAVVFFGNSKCPLCNEVIHEHEDIELFPPFVVNKSDPYYIFNDAGLHKKCLELSSLGSRAIEYREIVHYKTRPDNRVCDIGKNFITTPQHYMFIPLLTSNTEEKLSRFNFMTIDKGNLGIWKQKDDFLEIARQHAHENRWAQLAEFNYLEFLINKIGK